VDLSHSGSLVGRGSFHQWVSILPNLTGNQTHVLAVLCDEFDWDDDGIDILGDVPVNTGGSFVQFPIHRRTLRYLRKTTSTAVLVILMSVVLRVAYFDAGLSLLSVSSIPSSLLNRTPQSTVTVSAPIENSLRLELVTS
jgi:hypothetical protein